MVELHLDGREDSETSVVFSLADCVCVGKSYTAWKSKSDYFTLKKHTIGCGVKATYLGECMGANKLHNP